MKKRTLSMFLCLLLLCNALCFGVNAAEQGPPVDDPIDPEPYTYISSIGIDLDIASNGKADCYGSVFVPDTTKTIYLTIRLERRPLTSTSNNDWTNVTSWSTSGTYRVTLDNPYYVSHGYTYRLKIGVDLRDSNNILCESTAAVSNYVDY